MITQKSTRCKINLVKRKKIIALESRVRYKEAFQIHNYFHMNFTKTDKNFENKFGPLTIGSKSCVDLIFSKHSVTVLTTSFNLLCAFKCGILKVRFFYGPRYPKLSKLKEK